jgi:RimJ/RimL family protein N-acetyltransferase
MIYVQKFNEHLKEYPRIAEAFTAFKVQAADWYADNPEGYKHAISNFMHGAYACVKKPVLITTWGCLRLRTACMGDYDFINAIERDADSTPWVNNWTLGARIEKFGDNNFFQTVIEGGDGSPVGFIDFRDMLSGTQVELKRIVISEKNKGYGKESMYLAQKFAFEVLGREKLYLGTKLENARARHVYRAAGFTFTAHEHYAAFHIFKEDYLHSENGV